MSKKPEKPAFEDGQIYSEEMLAMNPLQRKQYLEGIAYNLEQNTHYSKKLTEQDLNEKRRELADVSIEINEIEREKKSAMDEFKVKEKPLKEMKSDLLTSIRSKTENRKGDVFLIDDQEKGLMYTFDQDGYNVGTRPLSRNERQLRIPSRLESNG